jgi:hypothetical protein
LAGCFSGHANKIPAVLSGNMVIPLSWPNLHNKCMWDGHENMETYVMQVQAEKILIYSPDTDVYNIGLPIIINREWMIVQ